MNESTRNTTNETSSANTVPVDPPRTAKKKTGLLYAFIRRIHLYTGLILVTFITMYFFTGLALSHATWFGEDAEPVETRTTHTLPADLRPTDADLPAKLADALDIPGQYHEAQSRGNNRWQINYNQPGTTHNVTVEADGTVTIVKRKLGFRQTLVGFHRTHGYGGGWFFNLWAFIMDLVNVAMVVFGLTGIYMWWKLTKKHALGWVLLIGGYGYTTVIILYLLYGP